MYLPHSTYRIQFHQGYSLKDLEVDLGYIHDLGIGAIYASPITKSTAGSTHGYDVTNSNQVDPEIGTISAFKKIADTLKSLDMGWIQDIVPNHMAFKLENEWISNLFFLGKRSEYKDFFDINWNHFEPSLKGKVMTPFLGSPLEEVLSRQELKLKLTTSGWVIAYFDNHYPVAVDCYQEIFGQANILFEEASIQDDKLTGSFFSLSREIIRLSNDQELDYELWMEYLRSFHQNMEKNPVNKKIISAIEKLYREDKARLRALLDKQIYHLCYWKETEQKINYRRFFTINDLICLNMEKPEVFRKYHESILHWVNTNLVQGVRVDHIDGLREPALYLNRLRNALGPDAYIVIEKILEWEETLPLNWPIQGTTGYGFMASLSHLFTDWRSKDQHNQIYQDFTGPQDDYDSITFEKKYFILKNRMGGELENMARLINDLNLAPDFLEYDRLKEALAIFLVGHTVYRIYPDHYPLPPRQIEVLKMAMERAANFNPEYTKELDYLFYVLTEFDSGNKLKNDNKLFFLKRCEQFSGPLEAKGVEDTSFYLYNRLISHNEVGDSPSLFGISYQEFHERMQRRMLLSPHALNATATHDTKRGEDARIRINVLSELPEEWQQYIQNWEQINEEFLHENEGIKVPAANDRYFLYQSLLGALPSGEPIDEEFRNRIKEYMLKVVREGKENSSWSEPNEKYEFLLQKFIDSILQPDGKFLSSFMHLFKKVNHYGMIYSLGQVLLKTTCPGIPDVYQGCELWDLSLVDPDNRRPVDFERRRQNLRLFNEQKITEKFLDDLWSDRNSGRIKHFILWKTLQMRKNNPDLFNFGQYFPLETEGQEKWRVVGFCRSYQNKMCLVMLPRHIAVQNGPNDLPVGETGWGDTSIHFPGGYGTRWTEIFSEKRYQFRDKILLAEVFLQFPLACLISD